MTPVHLILIGLCAVAALIALVRYLGDFALAFALFVLAGVAFFACTVLPTNEIAAGVTMPVMAIGVVMIKVRRKPETKAAVQQEQEATKAPEPVAEYHGEGTHEFKPPQKTDPYANVNLGGEMQGMSPVEQMNYLAGMLNFEDSQRKGDHLDFDEITAWLNSEGKY